MVSKGGKKVSVANALHAKKKSSGIKKKSKTKKAPSVDELLLYGKAGKKKGRKNSSRINPEDKLQSAAHQYMKERYPHVLVNADIAGIGIAACTHKARRNGRTTGWVSCYVYP